MLAVPARDQVQARVEVVFFKDGCLTPYLLHDSIPGTTIAFFFARRFIDCTHTSFATFTDAFVSLCVYFRGQKKYTGEFRTALLLGIPGI